MQEHLDLQPIFQLDLRLGEGTGAAPTMLVVVFQYTILLNEMATLAAANVAQRIMTAQILIAGVSSGVGKNHDYPSCGLAAARPAGAAFQGRP